MARPTVCGRCGLNLRRVPGRDERADSSDGVIVGFLECPRCGASYVYIRPSDR